LLHFKYKKKDFITLKWQEKEKVEEENQQEQELSQYQNQPRQDFNFPLVELQDL
jgi:hypothetical protein